MRDIRGVERSLLEYSSMRFSVILPALVLLPACFAPPQVVDCENSDDEVCAGYGTEGESTGIGSTSTASTDPATSPATGPGTSGTSGSDTSPSETGDESSTGDETTGGDETGTGTGGEPPELTQCGMMFSPLVGSIDNANDPGRIENAQIGITFDEAQGWNPSHLDAGSTLQLLSDPSEDRLEKLMGTLFYQAEGSMQNRSSWQMPPEFPPTVLESGPILHQVLIDHGTGDPDMWSVYTLIADGRLIRDASWHHPTASGNQAGYLVNYVALDYGAVTGVEWSGPQAGAESLGPAPASGVSEVLHNEDAFAQNYVCAFKEDSRREFVGFAGYGEPDWSGGPPASEGSPGHRITRSHPTGVSTTTLALQVDWIDSGTVNPNVARGQMLTFVGQDQEEEDDTYCGCLPQQHAVYVNPPALSFPGEDALSGILSGDAAGDGYDETSGVYGITLEGDGTLEIETDAAIPTLLVRLIGATAVTAVSLDDAVLAAGSTGVWEQQVSITPESGGDEVFVFVGTGLQPGQTLRIAY